MRQDVLHEMIFTLLECAYAGSSLTFADFLAVCNVHILLTGLHALLVSGRLSCYSRGRGSMSSF
jgi:hypothetical protein